MEYNTGVIMNQEEFNKMHKLAHEIDFSSYPISHATRDKLICEQKKILKEGDVNGL